MKTTHPPLAGRIRILTAGVFLAIVTNGLAQEVSAPGPSLNGAIRDALRKFGGPLTLQDLLRLTNLHSRFRDVRSLKGPSAAHNLTTHYLIGKQLTRVTLPAGLTNLTTLYLCGNKLANFALTLTNIKMTDAGGYTTESND